MSIVEKAAERLKALRAESSPTEEAMVPPPAATTVERWSEHQQRAPVADSPKVAVPGADRARPAVPAWHVDIERLVRNGLVPSDRKAKRRLDDELRRVKWPLLKHVGRNGQGAVTHAERIIVSSAAPGDGKTFTAWNLAQSLAREPDFEVLLVDGDIPKADITRALGLEGKPGLGDVLRHAEMAPASVIVPTDIPNLLVVPTGGRDPLMSELFSSLRMQSVLDAWRGRARPQHRLLVFDSSPLLATSESRTLASHMGQVVMIVAAGRTRVQELESAMHMLDDSQYVGLILNKSRLPSSESYYYDGYHSDPEPASQHEDT